MNARQLLPPVLVAALLRLSGIAWDGFTHQHPDERFLVMVTEALALPASPAEALDPWRTPLNPQNRGYRFFVYGALFPTLNLLAAKLTGLVHYGGLLRSGRVLSAAFDLLALVFLALTAARLAGPQVGGWLAWLYAFFGLAIQQARFATPDSLGLAAVAFTLWATLRPVSWGWALAAGLGVGWAAASRPNLAALALPATLALLLWPCPRLPAKPIFARLAMLALAGVAALASWKLLDPGFFASTLSPLPNPRRLASLRELAGQLAGEGQFPPNLQWVGRGPLFLAWNLLFWGTGPALGLALLAALVPTLRRAFLGDRRLWVLASFPLPALLWQATGLVVSARHALPSMPFLLLLLAFAARRWRPAWRWLTLAGTLPWGLAWAALAWQPYTRLEASRFLLEAVPAGAVVAVEAWDDALPIGFGWERFRYREIPAYAPDGEEKRQKLLTILQEAQVLVLSSQRAVGSICRVPDAYPLMSEFYHLLFCGQLGFRLAFTRERRLGWGSWGLSMVAAEEALSVYDHPPVWIFLKDQSFDGAKVAALLARVQPASRTDWHTRELEARGLPPYLVRQPALQPSPFSWRSSWLGQALSVMGWLLFLELAGFAGALVLHAGLRQPRELATLLGRPLGLLLVGLGVLWAGTLTLPGWRGWLPAGLVLVTSFCFRRQWSALVVSRQAAFARGLFLGSFALFLLLRAFNPEIYWGEKPMDAAIFHILLHSPSLPPQDPWFAGYPINYYFFGFLPDLAATVASASPFAVAFNLACATVPALTCLAAAAVGWFLSHRRLGALASALLAQLTGTAYLLVYPAHLPAPNFDRFWASSRVIPDAINEYPVWTALFADLHAHFLSFPGFCTVLALVIVLASGSPPRFLPHLLGLGLAAQFMSNSWELPTLLLLSLLAGLCAFWRHRLAARLVPFLATVALVALVACLPFLLTQGPVKARLFWERGSPLALGQLFELYGVHAGLCLLALPLAWRRISARRQYFMAGALLWACVLVVAPAYLTLQDKMNSYFKLGLQAFLLFGCLGGGLLALAFRPPWRLARRVAAPLAGTLLLAGLAESLWAAWAVVHTRWVPGPRPTLDGEAYLETFQPALAEALPALRAAPLRAAAEPAFPPYSDTLRVPMFAGLPAMVGWEYHLWQRGKSWAEIRLRAADLARILLGETEPAAQDLVDRWGVDLLAQWEKPAPALPAFSPLLPGNEHLRWRPPR